MTIQIKWWSSNDDPIVMMMQIPWWRRLEEEDDLEDDLKMKKNWRWRRLKDEEDLKRKNTWRQIRLEDEYKLKMKMTIWSSWYRKEDQCWKLCRKNTFLVKRECWCICNLGMYSSMYLMYCNPMFILGCTYYVFESCCHAPMFWSGGSIM